MCLLFDVIQRTEQLQKAMRANEATEMCVTVQAITIRCVKGTSK